jgi:hypothetical protein
MEQLIDLKVRARATLRDGSTVDGELMARVPVNIATAGWPKQKWNRPTLDVVTAITWNVEILEVLDAELIQEAVCSKT